MAVGGGGSDGASRCWDLPPEAESAGAARGLVGLACRDWGVDEEACDDALLVATELVSNVVDHAGTRCEVTFRADGEGLRIEVRDFYRCPPPRPRPLDLRARRGRGLHVVAALSIRWGVTEFDDGKSVWAVLPIPGPPSPPRRR
jgi:anti-sigma regulatory factor (Ser/Thr protein kinase)